MWLKKEIWEEYDLLLGSEATDKFLNILEKLNELDKEKKMVQEFERNGRSRSKLFVRFMKIRDDLLHNNPEKYGSFCSLVHALFIDCGDHVNCKASNTF